jgi:hypothetical protein
VTSDEVGDAPWTEDHLQEWLITQTVMPSDAAREHAERLRAAREQDRRGGG